MSFCCLKPVSVVFEKISASSMLEANMKNEHQIPSNGHLLK